MFDEFKWCDVACVCAFLQHEKRLREEISSVGNDVTSHDEKLHSFSAHCATLEKNIGEEQKRREVKKKEEEERIEQVRWSPWYCV